MEFMTAGACFQQTAIDSAKELFEIWGEDVDQIEAHLESEGFDPSEIQDALDVVVPDRSPFFVLVCE